MEVRFTIRPAQAKDENFLREMLLETLRSEEDGETYTLESLEEPRLALYVKGWGTQDGDLGFIAETQEGHKLGAVWGRLFPGNQPGYGFVDEDIPEIAIAVTDRSRGLGVGSELLKSQIEESKKDFRALSLSVAPNNPAKRLYERYGFETVAYDDQHPIMLLEF